MAPVLVCAYSVVAAVAASLSWWWRSLSLHLAYDVALSRGAVLPGGDLRVLAVAVYIVRAGGPSLITYLVVRSRPVRGRSPGGPRGARRRHLRRRTIRRSCSWWRSRSAAALLERLTFGGPGVYVTHHFRGRLHAGLVHPYHSTHTLHRQSSRCAPGIRLTSTKSRSTRVSIDEQHVALPKLYGAPARPRPPSSPSRSSARSTRMSFHSRRSGRTRSASSSTCCQPAPSPPVGSPSDATAMPRTDTGLACARDRSACARSPASSGAARSTLGITPNAV